jgi:hypothetical protein
MSSRAMVIICSLAAMCGAAHASEFSYTGSAQTFDVSMTGTYEIVTYGAAGGSNSSFSGGQGAELDAFFNLTAGQVLSIDVGGAGSNASYGAGGAEEVSSSSTPMGF